MCDLAKTLNMTQSAISHQLRIFKADEAREKQKGRKDSILFSCRRHIKTIINQGMEHIQEYKEKPRAGKAANRRKPTKQGKVDGKREKGMTRETRKRELEIGIGLVLYLLAFLISMQAKMKSKAEMLLFLLPYIVSAISIYKEQAEKFLKKQFLDENLLMIIATVGAFFVGRYKEAVAAIALLSGRKTCRRNLSEQDEKIYCEIY